MSSENVLTPYEKVLAARKSDRPDIMKYIEVLFDDFIEMHGDRYYKDDKSLVAGTDCRHRQAVSTNSRSS